MFLRITPRKAGNKVHKYAEFVESYRENGKVKQRRLKYLGKVDDETARKLKFAFSKKSDKFVDLDSLEICESFAYGHYHLLHHLGKELGLFEYMQSHFTSNDSHITVSTAVKYLKALVLQRIIDPDSKHALVEWQENTPLKYLGIKELDLQTLYRSMEILEHNFALVEQYLYNVAVKKFHQNEKELFYDITSSYFEGRGCVIAAYGYSRDRRKDRKQIVIGLVTTVDGFPIKCKVFPGNRLDKTTVTEVIEELSKEYSAQDIVLVGDRGMFTHDNTTDIESLNQHYIMTMPRDWSKKHLKNVKICPTHMNKVQEDLYGVFVENEGHYRVLLCLNTQKRKDEQEYRRQKMDQMQQELEELNASLGTNKRIKNRDDAMKKAGMILKNNKVRKYFDVYTTDSSNNSLGFEVTWLKNERKIQEDERLDGTFVIQTNVTDYSDKKLIYIYKNLHKVENAFKVIKNVLDLRPMMHYKQIRVEAHVYLCVIAYFILTACEYISRKKELNVSTPKILKKLSKIHLIDIFLDDDKHKYVITKRNKAQKEILQAFGIKNIKIPETS